jgi:hypothetical protein
MLPTKTFYESLFSPIRATCHTHLILLILIVLIISGQYKSRSSSLCNFLQFLLTSSVLVPNTFLSTLLLRPLAYVLPLLWKADFHNHVMQQKNLRSEYFNFYVLRENWKTFWTACCRHFQI